MLPATSNPHGLPVHAERIARQFDFGPKDVASTTNYFVKQMRSALKHNGTTQIPSFVTKVPNGSEKGIFLAVDLGGTNCRVCSVNLHGNSTYTMVQSKYAVPRDLMVNSSYKPLFNFIAEKIGDFLREHPEANIDLEGEGLEKGLQRAEYRRLGFTFSFTYKNISLSSGTMLQWDKGWDIPDALGRDPCEMLQNAVDELRLPVLVSALTNDSVGTLMARAYTSPWRSATLIGAIFGTGTNAAYLERLENTTKLEPLNESARHSRDGEMVINTEWGAWPDQDTAVLPTTSYDKSLDVASTNPKVQTLEKRVSGLYLGELARLAILQLTQDNLFDMSVDEDSPLTKQYGINSSFLTLVAKESEKSLDDVKHQISITLKAHNVSEEDVRAIRLITTAIVRRAARLAGAAMAATIIQSGRLSNTRSKPKVNRSSHGPLPRFGSLSKVCILIGTLFRRIFHRLGFTQSHPMMPAALHSEVSISEDDIIDIGVDGLLFEAYPTFEEDVRGAMRDVPQIGPWGERRIQIGLTKDGSSVGAALVAQSVCKII